MGTAAYSDVIEGCIKGERKAQKLLYEHLAPKMFSVCLRYMGERKAAEDVLQDAFVTLFVRRMGETDLCQYCTYVPAEKRRAQDER